MENQDAPFEGQDVKSLAESLFSDSSPEDTTPVEETVLESNKVVPIVPVIPVEQVAPVTPVVPVAPVQQTQVKQDLVVLDAEKIAQFEAWQRLQQSQQVQPVQPVVAPTQQQQLQPPIQQQQQRSLAPAEVDRMLNKFTLTQKEYDSIFKTNTEAESIAALNEVLQNTVKQAVTMSFHLVQDSQARVAQQVQPYMQFADSQRELMLREAFFTQHPDLRGAEPVLNAVMTQMAQSGQKFVGDQKALFDAVAKSTKDQLTLLGVTKGQVNSPAQRNASVKRPMAALPVGGQGGSQQSAGNGQGVESNTARSIFG